MMNSLVVLIVILYMCVADCQRVAPGVPPQHYQPPPPAQQYQVPQQQYAPQGQYQQPLQQQVPLQQQQVPIQQMQHIPVQQQVPVQQQGHHHDHNRQKQILNAANVAQEAQHIAEHAPVPIDTSKMTEQELQFYYFKMYDSDNNNKLDGCELTKSLIHWHEQGGKDKQAVEEKIFKDEELINLIDPILNVDDHNKDGYIDYPEFIRAQQKAAGGQPKPQA